MSCYRACMASLTSKDRGDLALRIRERRESIYGTKRAAYQDAKVNPTTWDRAEMGEPVRDDIMRRIVRLLWPASDGDWRRIDDATRDDNDNGDGEVSPELRAVIRQTVREVLAAEHDTSALKSS